MQSFYCYSFLYTVLCKLIDRSFFSRYTMFHHFFWCAFGKISIAAVAPSIAWRVGKVENTLYDATYDFISLNGVVATSPVVLRWLYDSPRTGWAWRTAPYTYAARASNSKRDCDVAALPILTCERLNMMTSVRKERLRAWSLLLLTATVRSFAHTPLGISDRNSVIEWSQFFLLCVVESHTCQNICHL